MPRVRVPRPTPRTLYRVFALNQRVADDWEVLVRTRLGPCAECWDHIATLPRQTLGKRYAPLKGELAQCTCEGQVLRQWQWEIDRRARVRVAIGPDFVVIMHVSSGHPKENE